MSNISDLVEHYLKKLLADSPHNYIEVQRSELALRFNCVPSQINYVLATRFSTGQGYIVESRRGGGGFIRIVKIPFNQQAQLILDLCEIIGDSISQTEAEGLIKRLQEENLITRREARMMQAAIGRDTLRLVLPARDRLRALILKGMVTAVLRD
ncbi:MAG: CtsR family transcriptional regulator [Pelotomaculum sp.]|uniref:Transcriptional regulator CtsR n=1 Tax=Pelotomaculum thermopropionicum (strain DSM 13744 / JCM 10971 / SI) TaxID=370438 RepID=A5D5K5_PELTS|nr:CtsR family transcriptional regulator [Pelotomaculum sp.]BAF58461.1 transcriptional repressor of class III stress genes [Pelotomaculum thermopropionicum SI]